MSFIERNPGKTLLIAVAMVIALLVVTARCAEAQDRTVKFIGWNSFVKGLTYVVRPDGFAEWHHDGKELDTYMVVEVPANTLAKRQVYEMTSSGDATTYLVVLEPELSVSGRQVSLRAMFSCNVPAPECSALLSQILSGRFSMQATASARRDETDLGHATLEFYINSTGRFQF